MENYYEIYDKSVELLKIIIFGDVFQKSFPYALAFVAIFLFVSLHRQRYNFKLFHLKLKSMGATTIIYFINLVVFAPIFMGTVKYLQGLYYTLDLPQLDPAMWQDLPIYLLIPLTLIIYDFADYWNHRLMHKTWLWPVHAIHHSETDMTGLTTYRVHFLEPVIMGISYVLLLSWLGLPESVLGYGAIVLALHNVYVHMDIDWGHGPFRLVLASPRYHRWHHADVPEAHGKNLANFFPVFDVLFGTYYVPGTCAVRLGARGVPENDVAKLLLYPFKEWLQMLGRLMPRIRAEKRDPEQI